MMKIKLRTGVLVLAACLAFSLMTGAEAKNAPFSVSADELNYDMKTGDGSATGKTTIIQDGAVTVAQGGGTFNSKTKSGHLKGGVDGKRGDEHLSSSELIIHDENFISAIGDAEITKGDKTLNAYQVDYHKDSQFMETIGDRARLSSTDGSWLNASKITYDMNAGVANATGGVTLASPPRDLTGAGDRAVYETKNDGYIELIGNAKATQDGNSVSGNRLRITNVGDHTQALGNVRLVYYPKSKESSTIGASLGLKPSLVSVAKTEVPLSVVAGDPAGNVIKEQQADMSAAVAAVNEAAQAAAGQAEVSA
jgi:lipopolysaccharide export system protein LptA